MTFPSWRYHATEQPRCVSDILEHEELGAEWTDTPAAFEAVEPVTDDEDKADAGQQDGDDAEQHEGVQPEEQLSGDDKKSKKAAADKARREKKKAAAAAAE